MGSLLEYNWYIIQTVYAGWCIFWAIANYRAIDKSNETILHWANGLMHLSVAIFFGLTVSWLLAILLLLIGRLCFDTFLNIFRKKGIGYVPKNPKSFVDKIEKSIFHENGILPKIIYASLILIINILKLIW